MRYRLVTLAFASLASAVAFGQVLANGVPTINLDRGTSTGSTPMEVGYHPGFNQYYGGNGGNPGYSGLVWDASGSRIQNYVPVGVDIRGVNYNSNSNAIEIVSYAARIGGSGRGLLRMGLDGSGLYDGTSTTILSSMPGVANDQSMPSYDSARDRFYSRDTGATVNIADGTGALLSTVNLDVASAGNPTLQGYFLGYDSFFDVFVAASSVTDSAYVFNMAGGFLGASQLANFTPTQGNFNAGYANGQIFVFDTAANAYHGFRVLVPEPATMTVLGIPVLALMRRRRRA